MNKLGAIGSAAAAIGSAALYHHINISDPNSEYISIGPVSPDTEKNIQKMDETHQSKVDDILSSVTIEYQEGNATDTMISIERKIVKQFLEQILRLFESQKIPLSYANIKQELEKDPEMMKKVQKEARELLKNLGASNDTYFYDIEEKFSDLSKEDHIRLLSILDELPVDALAYLTQQFDQDYDVHLAYAKGILENQDRDNSYDYGLDLMSPDKWSMIEQELLSKSYGKRVQGEDGEWKTEGAATADAFERDLVDNMSEYSYQVLGENPRSIEDFDTLNTNHNFITANDRLVKSRIILGYSPNYHWNTLPTGGGVELVLSKNLADIDTIDSVMNELRENSEFLKNYNSKAGKFIDIVRKHNIYYGAAILGLSHYDPSDGFMSEENIEKYNDLGLFDEGAKERYDAIYEKKRSNSGGEYNDSVSQ